MDSSKSLLEECPQPIGAEPAEKVSSQTMKAQRTRLLLPAFLTALLLWLSYFNQIGFGEHSITFALGWLGWVALVPFLVLVRSNARPMRLYLAACLSGLLFYVPVLQWLRVADYRMYATWVGLALFCSLFTPLALVLLRSLRRRTSIPLIVSVPAVWTALE